MSWEDKIKDIADYFWCAAISYCTAQEFGSPENAKSFDDVWKEFIERSKKK